MSLFKMLPMLLFLTLGIRIKNSSYCMTDRNSSLHKPSLYEQICCHPCNIGKNFKLKKDKTIEIIMCSPSIPESCLIQYEGNIIVISLHHYWFYRRERL